MFDAVNQDIGIQERICSIRNNLRESGKSLRGGLFLGDDVLKSIRSVASEIFDSVSSRKDDAIQIMERFEEMCRRTKQKTDDNLRPDILRHLDEELQINQKSLAVPAKKLISFTLYFGAEGPKLLKEFSVFSDITSIIRHSVVFYPSDPHGFLTYVNKTIEKITTEKEFSVLADTAGVFRRAAVSNPADPRKFLRNILKTTDELSKNKEFAEFFNTPSILRYAAIHYYSNPQAFLRNVQKTIAELKQEKEFTEFANIPGILRYAAIHNNTKPRAFLRNVKKTIMEMAKEKEFAEFFHTPQIFLYAASKSPDKPRDFLRNVQKNIREISKEKEFADFLGTPSMILRAAVSRPNAPREFLRNLRKTTSELAQEFIEFSKYLEMMACAEANNLSALRHSQNKSKSEKSTQELALS